MYKTANLAVAIKVPQIRCLGLSLLAGILLSIVYTVNFTSIIIFLVFVPLFYLERYTTSRLAYWFYAYLSLVVWNFFTAFWIFKINQTGALTIIFCNSLILSIPFALYISFRKVFSFFISIAAFISCWITLEYLHNNWQLAFPYLTLGYTLARLYFLIQWYEFLGVHGGSLWILAVNCLVYNALQKPHKVVGKWKMLLLILATLLLPSIWSLYLYSKPLKNGTKLNFLALHPNTDCYTYKYKINQDTLIDEYLNLVSSKINAGTDCIVFPETAITSRVWFGEVSANRRIKKIRTWFAKYPNTDLVTGVFIDEKVEINPWIKSERKPHLKSDSNGNYFFSYNAAIQLNSGAGRVPVYTKRKLVPMEETLPYPHLFMHIGQFFKSLGGFKFAAREKNDELFKLSSKGLYLAPIICYESIFGEYVASKVKSGANVIAVMLNEGWYQNHTTAWRFVDFSIVRAIENRRSVVRSSNMGITCIIDEHGEIIKSLQEFKPGILKGTLSANSRLTFYTQHGDYLGKIAMCILVIMIAVLEVNRLMLRIK